MLLIRFSREIEIADETPGDKEGVLLYPGLSKVYIIPVVIQ